VDRRDFAAALESLTRRRDQVLPALHVVHAAQGWLSEPALEAVSDLTSVPLSELYGVARSYSEFRFAPPHEPRAEICTGLSCRLAGADELRETPGMLIPVEAVECRFLCGVAPVAEIDGRYLGRLKARRVSTITDLTHKVAPTKPRRITVGDSLCARSTGSDAVVAALQQTYPDAEVVRVGCDGMCWAQPVVTVANDAGGVERFEQVSEDDPGRLHASTSAISVADAYHGQVRHVLGRCGVVDPMSLADARAHGSYQALERARSLPAMELVTMVKEAGLRGRGGAYFPMATKWESVLVHPAPRYLVVNAEEGEPGAFKDRHLMEGDPHLLIEGIAIAAHAIGAARVFLYINGQAQLAAERMAMAVADAGAAGLLGSDLSIEIYRGAGGYVCGEESVILNSIEGERAVPRPRPPLPTDAGLWGRPTVISNVETLCNLPLIVTDGIAGFREFGTEQYPGTKLVSVSGAVRRPGLYEVAIGITARSLLELAGGLEPGRTLRALVMGGPSGGFLPPDLLDTPLVGGLIHPTGAVLGSGGVVVLDDRMSVSLALRELTAYNTAESCGKCTPCREGTARALEILDRAEESGGLSEEERGELLELCDVLQYASLCGLGQMAPGPIRSALALFD
jgi:NADH:ubiquinone oxidoreductase subunit F (NADH-binding)/NADH:ubiquinone oxidoreductase subunit E